MTKRLYTVPPPISMRGSLMLSGDFYVPNSSDGVKTAAWLSESTLEDRKELFKVAIEKDTRDLAAAYNAMCNQGAATKAKEAPQIELDDEDDDYGKDTFAEPDDLEDDDDD